MAAQRRQSHDDSPDDQNPEPLPRKVVPIRDVEDLYVFRFEVGPAILAQLKEKLKLIPPSPLLDSLHAKYPGFYQLLLDNAPVYIGKTSRPIGQRLKEHARKLRGRVGIDIDLVWCRYAFVEDPSLVDVAEEALIEYFGALNLADWNRTGFGSKVTGHGRSRQEVSDWSERYPPDYSAEITAGSNSESLTLVKLAGQIMRQAPISFSLPNKLRQEFKKDHPEEREYPVALASFEEWVAVIESELGGGWEVVRQGEGWYIEKKQ